MAFAGLSTQLANRTREKQFERGVLPYAGTLLQAGLRFTRDLPLAEDLVQQTLLQAWYEFEHLEDAECRVWLFRTLLSLWNQDHRLTCSSLCSAVQPEKGGAAISSSLQPREQEDVCNAVDHLRDDLRTVLLLFSVEGFSCAEISEILTIPVDTVISNLAFARRLVQNGLGTQPLLRAAR